MAKAFGYLTHWLTCWVGVPSILPRHFPEEDGIIGGLVEFNERVLDSKIVNIFMSLNVEGR